MGRDRLDGLRTCVRTEDWHVYCKSWWNGPNGSWMCTVQGHCAMFHVGMAQES